MSYSISLYLVDMDKLEQHVGSGDEDFLARVVENNPEEMDEEEEDDEDDELTLKGAVDQLILGGDKDPEEAHQYGYALLEFCDTLGESAPVGDGGEANWQTVEDSGLAKLFEQSGPPVPLLPSDDFPTIGHVRHAKISAALSGLEDDELDADAEDLRDDFIAAAKKAQQEGLDLILFYF
ncbi:MAG: hypothetical protein AAGA92_06470 [Planctomycetota bacterium]